MCVSKDTISHWCRDIELTDKQEGSSKRKEFGQHKVQL
jgi:hypothetical protein